MNTPVHVLLSCVVLVASCGGQATAPPSSPVAKPRGIEGHVAHLKANGQAPKDYVLGLFRSHDVVILGERLHPELTQWELIYDLVTDPRFVEQVGTIYTEYGAVNLQDRLDRYLADPRAEREQLLGILRDFGNWPIGWGNPNFIEFLDRLRRFNTSQPEGRRVRLVFADCFWDWRALDEHNYAAFARETLFARDFLMAKRIEVGITVDQPRDRKKALVIMNTRHSYVIDSHNTGGALDDNTGSYLRGLLPGRSVVSVLLNTTARPPGSNDRDGAAALIAGGKWDAAFRALGDHPIGFDLQGSAFGDDTFDLLERYGRLHYRDVYHGVVFVNPLAKHTKQEIARGYMTGEFVTEVRRRLGYASIGRNATEAADNRQRLERFLELVTMPALLPMIEDELFGPRSVYSPDQLARFEEQIVSWL